MLKAKTGDKFFQTIKELSIKLRRYNSDELERKLKNIGATYSRSAIKLPVDTTNIETCNYYLRVSLGKIFSLKFYRRAGQNVIVEENISKFLSSPEYCSNAIDKLKDIQT